MNIEDIGKSGGNYIEEEMLQKFKNNENQIEIEMIKQAVQLESMELNFPQECILNTFKFGKPPKGQTNDFKSKYNFSDEERMRIICEKVDQGVIHDFEKDFYKEAQEFIIEKGKSKLRVRNTTAINNNKKNIEDYTDQNLLEIKPGKFKLMSIILDDYIFSALLDTGASHSLINVEVLKQLGIAWTPQKMIVSCANDKKDEDNVCGKVKLKIKLKQTNGEYVFTTVKLLVLKSTNDFLMIIGADILFKRKNFQITEKFWSFKEKNGPLIKIELIEMEERTEKGTLERIKNTKTESRIELKLNNMSCEKNYTKKVSGKPSSKEVKNEFEEFLKYELPKNDIEYKGQPSHGYDTESEVNENFPQLLLNDNYAENFLNSSETDLIKESNYISEEYTLRTIKTSHIPSEWRPQINMLCEKYEDIFAKHNFDIPQIRNFEHELQFRAIPESQQMRFMNADKFQFAKEAVEKLEKAGVVELCTNPLAVSNLVMVRKFEGYKDMTKAGEIARNASTAHAYRLAQDFRNINLAITNQKRSNPIDIENFVKTLSNKIVSSIDFLQGYFQISLESFSSRCTCFYLGRKIYRWKRLGQGLLSSGQVFNECMDQIFSTEHFNEFAKLPEMKKKLANRQKTENYIEWENYDNFLLRYVDDLYVHTYTHSDHMIALELLFLATQKCNGKLNPKKCRFLTEQVTVLGYHLDTKSTTTYIEQLKCSAIINWTRPASLFELHSRLCTLGYFQKYLPKMKEICYPLFHAIRKKEFNWNESMEFAWQALKILIKVDIQLTVPDSNERLYLFSDASLQSCSQILFVERNKKLQVVCVNSQIFSYLDARKNSHVKEGLSLCLGLKKFRTYIESSKLPLIVFTDCKSLIFAGRTKDYNISCANISSFLSRFASEHDIMILHIAGKWNFLADLFSRSFNKSRFLGKPAVSKSIAEELPQLNERFCMDQETLYQFLAAPFRIDEKNGFSPRKTPVVKVPTKYMRKIFLEVTPEDLAISQRTLFEQKNDITKQINAKEVKRMERLNEQTKKADKLFNNHFDIEEITEEYEDDTIINGFTPDIHRELTQKRTFNIDYDTECLDDCMVQYIYANKNFCKDDRIRMDKTTMVVKGKNIRLQTNIHSNRSFKLQSLIVELELSLEINCNGIQLLYTNNSSCDIELEEHRELCIFITDCKHEVKGSDEKSKFFSDIKVSECEEQSLFHRIRDLTEHIFNHNMDVTVNNISDFKGSWRYFQENDALCVKIRNDKLREYIEIDEILYRQGKPHLLVVPKILLVPLITFYHQKTHASFVMLYQTLKKKFFHPDIRKSCAKVIELCFVCQLIQTNSSKKNKLNTNTRKYLPLEPRKAWSCDLITGLSASELNNTAFLILSDIKTRFTVCYPIKNKMKNEVKKAFLSHMLSFMHPTMYVCDADIAILSPLYELQANFEFIVKTSAPKSQFQNLVECSFKSLKNLIMRQLYDHNTPGSFKKWEFSLYYAVKAYNSLTAYDQNFTREVLMFNNDINENNTICATKKPKRKEIDNAPFKEGMIIFIKDQSSVQQGVSSVFKNKDSSPMKIVRVLHKEKVVIARNLESQKHFYVAYHRIRPVTRANEIPPLMEKRIIDSIFCQDKRSTYALRERNNIEFDKNLREKVYMNEIEELDEIK